MRHNWQKQREFLERHFDLVIALGLLAGLAALAGMGYTP